MGKRNVLLSILLFSSIISINLYASDKDIKVVLVLWRGITEAEEGFKDKLIELGYNTNYTIVNAEQDKIKLANSLRNRIKPKLNEYDYIYSFGTTSTEVTQKILNGKLPHIFNIVADPVKAGIAQSMDSAGQNLSGVSHKISMKLQLDTALNIIDFKNLGFIYNAREKNSYMLLDELKEVAKINNFNIVPFRVVPEGNILNKKLIEIANKSKSIDAVYLSLDSFLLTNAEQICNELTKSGIPSIGSIKGYLTAGALTGLVPDYYELGGVAATILDRCEHGEKLENIPIETEQNPQFMINKSSQTIFNITIPPDISNKTIYVD